MEVTLSTGIVIFGVSITVFVFTLLVRKSTKTKGNLYLAAWLLLVVLHLLFLGAGFQNHLDKLPLVTAFGNALPLLHIFLVSLYIREVYQKASTRLVVIYCLTFLGYVLLFFTMGKLGYTRQVGLLIVYSNHAPLWTYLVTTSFIPIFAALTLVLFNKIKGYRFKIKTLYSDGIRTNVDWLNYWLTSYLMASLLIIGSIFLGDMEIMVIESSFLIVCAVLTLQVFMVGQIGAARNFSFPEMGAMKKYAASGLKEQDKEKLKRKLTTYFESEKPYLDPELNLMDLAEALQLPAYQISQLINETMESSFFDLINRYRIDEFKMRLANPDNSHLTIFGVAQDSGFNSKSGFYKVFKKVTGKSPNEYRQSII
ncbi:helix-turn-helix domain-containing protein [Muricauda sp. JGD-17]|uniref:Helix-turn-helix domain-containing protein n=1 Tax=Flagellimonas ochracea TaxID=2696472 RepID=A0A964TCD8_9FLAO|nr:helix-turn-helix domain-containing protein [Allomuricauda ochracea]NAY92293.1 helix-turn-helix domain-containing protein [Allomuricauda ochracea]